MAKLFAIQVMYVSTSFTMVLNNLFQFRENKLNVIQFEEFKVNNPNSQTAEYAKIFIA